MQAFQKIKEDVKAARARMGIGGPAKFYDPEQHLRPVIQRLAPLPPPEPEPVKMTPIAKWRIGMEVDEEKMTKRGRELAAMARDSGHRLYSRRVGDECRTKESMAVRRRRMANIICASSKYFDVREEMILSRARAKEISRARQIAAYLARKHGAGSGFIQIGRAFNLDHTTIMHAVKKISRLISSGDAQTIKDISAIEAILGVEG
jgi:hypothetical protein